jgi:hypothetical protein
VATSPGTWTGGAASSIYIGNVNPLSAFYFQGNIQALAIYNRQLTDAEIAQIYYQMTGITATNSPQGISLDASNSVAVADGASISSYSWSYTPSGLTASIQNASAAQTRFYPTLGEKYWLHCTVTDDNGKSSTGRRPFIVDDSNNSEAIKEFSRGALTEQFDNHRVSLSLTITAPDGDGVTWSDFDREALVILTAKDRYNGEPGTISFRDTSVYDDRQHILFCGYTVNETRNLDDDGGGNVQLTALNSIGMFLYSLSLTGVRSATDWYEMDSSLMTVAALLFHLFKWQSTLLEIQDWWLPWSDTVKRSAVEEWTEGDIVDRAKTLAGPHGRLMAITANSQGEMFIETDLNLRSQADRNAETTTLTLVDGDIQEAKQAKIQQRPQVSQVFLSGGNSEGVIGSFEPFLSISQNVRLATAGAGGMNFERLMLPDQTEANRLCGRIQTVANREHVEIPLTFSGIYREVFSPADQQWTNTGNTFSASLRANIRGTADLVSIRMVPRTVTKRGSNDGSQFTDVIFEIEAPEGLTGRTIVLPDVDPNYVPPDPDTTPSLIGSPTPSTILVTGDDTNGVEIYDNTTWVSRNTGLSGDSLKVRDLKVSPFWWLLQNSSDWEDVILWIATDGGIYTSNDAGKSWLDRTPLAALASAPAGVTPSTVAYISIDVFGSSTDINRTIVAQCREQVAGVWHSWDLISTNGGLNWSNVKQT